MRGWVLLSNFGLPGSFSCTFASAFFPTSKSSVQLFRKLFCPLSLTTSPSCQCAICSWPHTHTHNSFFFLFSFFKFCFKCLFTSLVAFEFPVLIPLLVCYTDRRSVVVYLCALILSNETFPYCTLPYVTLTLLEVTKLDLLQGTIPDKRITPTDAESFEVMLGSTTFSAPESLFSLSGCCFVPLQVFIHFIPA